MVSLYLHIPFCKKKCRYCDFFSYENSLHFADEYIDALLKEAELYNGEDVATVFIGGGTPSLLSPEQFERLVLGINDVFNMSGCVEFTVEVNPESVDSNKILLYKKLGVNRVSMGLQSTVDSELKMLGRIHTYNDFLKSYDITASVFDNVNIDIISALPNQKISDFETTLKRVTDLKPQHISVYSLIPEPDTPLALDMESKVLNMPDDETDRAIYELTGDFLRSNGYNRYEISNYALTGRECKHNLVYWKGGDYVGLGCAAHSLYKGYRSSHCVDINEYIESPEPDLYQKLTKTDAIEEFIMLRLRLNEGFSLDEFEDNFGYDISKEKADEIALLLANKLIDTSDKRIRLTTKGLNVCDSIILKLI